MDVESWDIDALSGKVLDGTFRIDEPLGRGGMGAVFAATQLRTGRRYAIKVLLPEIAVRRDAVARLKREAMAAGALGHANVIAVHDIRESDGLAWLVMDLLEGEDLAARMKRLGRMRLDEATLLLAQMAAGLEAAHARGLVHRDLKPANVFLARQPGSPERAVLLDFGLAKSFEDAAMDLTQSGVVMGTPQYMSPEQANGQPLDSRADLYALATIFYEMLAGEPPFRAPTLPALFAKLASAPPPPIDLHRPDLPVGMVAVLERALAKAPADRYPDATGLLNAVRACSAGALPMTAASPVSGRPPPPTPVGNHAQSWPRPGAPVDAHAPTMATPAEVGLPAATPSPPQRRRSPWPWLAAVALIAAFVLAGGGAGLYLWYLARVSDQMAEAPRLLQEQHDEALRRAREAEPSVVVPAVEPPVQDEPQTEAAETQAAETEAAPPEEEEAPVTPVEVRRPRRPAAPRARERAASPEAPTPPAAPAATAPPASGPPAGVPESGADKGRPDDAGGNPET
ncbi:MAG: protein kinase, partial [Myxococcota bacterium]|nr:protein kinase [Myxococcota bacterium]